LGRSQFPSLSYGQNSHDLNEEDGDHASVASGSVFDLEPEIGDAAGEDEIPDDEEFDLEEEALEEIADADDSESSDEDIVSARSKPKPARRVGGVRQKSKPRRPTVAQWTRTDFAYLNLGTLRDDDEKEVSEEDLKAGDAYVLRELQIRCQQKKGITGGFQGYLRTLRPEGAFQIFCANTPKSRRAYLGTQVCAGKPFDLEEFLRLPGVTDEQLNAPGIYAGVTVRQNGTPRPRIGHYVGAGNRRLHRKPGLGPRLMQYNMCKRKAVEEGKLVPTAGSKSLSRHVREALADDAEWHFRTLSTFAPGTPKCAVNLLEGIWVDVLQTLTQEIPPETSRSRPFQNETTVAAYMETIPNDRTELTFIPLNGAHPFAQGSKEYSLSAHEFLWEQCHGLCGIYELPLPPWEEFKKMVLIRIPAISMLPLHVNCKLNAAYRIRKMKGLPETEPQRDETIREMIVELKQDQHLKIQYSARTVQGAHSVEKMDTVAKKQHYICPVCKRDYSDSRQDSGYWRPHPIAGHEGEFACEGCRSSYAKKKSNVTDDTWLEGRKSVDYNGQVITLPANKFVTLEIAAQREQNLYCKSCRTTIPLGAGNANENSKKRWTENIMPITRDLEGWKYVCTQCRENWRTLLYNKKRGDQKYRGMSDRDMVNEFGKRRGWSV
jgi:hypothetical protein